LIREKNPDLPSAFSSATLSFIVILLLDWPSVELIARQLPMAAGTD
jgi:hypothetical protein